MDFRSTAAPAVSGERLDFPESLAVFPAYLSALEQLEDDLPEEAMNQTIAIDCPAEILVSLHMNVEGLGGFMKQQAAIALFREGCLSSGTAVTVRHNPCYRIGVHPTLVERLCRLAGEA